MRLIFLPTVLVLAWVLHHNIRKNNGNDRETVSSYLKREETANATRRKDISHLPYIQVPLDTLPLDITLKDENMQSKIVEYKKIIMDLSGKKMLNLIGISNTELKEQYGPANLDQLSIYDQNYSKYIRTLSLLANCLITENEKAAVEISEYCIRTGTDISSTYALLGTYYMKEKRYEDFENLYHYIPDKNSVIGKVTVNKLNAIRESEKSENEEII